MNDIKVYTVNDIMDLLKISRRTLYTYIKDEKIKGNKIGNKWIFTEQQVKDFIEGKTEKKD